MSVTNVDNQPVKLKKRLTNFLKDSKTYAKKHGHCATRDVLAIVLDKWSLFVLYNLSYFDVMRFGEIKSKIRKISSRMLSVTLKKLEQQGLVERKQFAEVPPRVEYSLTDFGKEFTEKTLSLNEWFLSALSK